MNSWITLRKSLTRMVDAWSFGNEAQDAVSLAMVRAVEAMHDGKHGRDVARAIRDAFREFGRIGWNESQYEDITVLEGIEAALDHYRDGGVYLEELAINAMMDAIDEDDNERAQEIQRALWEWEVTLDEFHPEAMTVFEINPDTAVEQSIESAYPNLAQREQALKASAGGAGYLSFDKPVAEGEYDEYTPIYKTPDLDYDLAYKAACKMNSGVFAYVAKNLDKWAVAVAHLKKAGEGLMDVELACMTSHLKEWNPNPKMIEALCFQAFDFNLLDEDVAYYLEDRDTEEIPAIEFEGTQEDTDTLANMICLPPEHPKWNPKNDQDFIKGGRFLESREPLGQCTTAGWEAYRKSDTKSKSKRNRLGRLRVRTIGPAGISNDNGRFFSWEYLGKLGAQMPKAILAEPRVREQVQEAFDTRGVAQ